MSAGKLSSLGGLVAIACAIFLCSTIASGELSCLDENGKPVDWYIGYKFPKLEGHPLFNSGYAYSYITSDDVDTDKIEPRSEIDTENSEPPSFLNRFKNLFMRFVHGLKPHAAAKKLKSTSTEPRVSRKDRKLPQEEQFKWIVSDRLINESESGILQTIAAACNEEKCNMISSIYYNDDPSGTDAELAAENKNRNGNSKRAHAKGILLMDEKNDNGIWLTHSVPRFPTVRKQPLEYPESGGIFGQTFMCVSLNLTTSANQIINHLSNMRPLVYDSKVSGRLIERFPNLRSLDIHEKTKYKRFSTQPKLAQTMTTKGGQVLSLFSKSTSFVEDFYDGWIDSEIGADLYVETWRNGRGGVLNSTCPPNEHHVNNVLELKYDNQLKWSYLKDHSKWAISDRQDLGIVCIGDLNRMQSQFARGGGAVCIKCATCWEKFSNTILDTQPCPIKQKS